MSAPSPTESRGPWDRHVLTRPNLADQTCRPMNRGGRKLAW